MDGARAFWNGEEIISKKSNSIECPSWFVEGLPKNIALDGELWMGRGTYENTLAVLGSLISNPSWKQMKYMIFDLPFSDQPYELRMEELKKIQLPSHAMIIQNFRCSGNDHLLKCLNDITREKGEGFILIKPQSVYASGKQLSMLKVKVGVSIILINLKDSP